MTATLALVLAYLGFVFAAVPYIGPIWSPWVLSVASLSFVLAFVLITHGRALWAVSLVVLVTLLFPIAVLLAVGWSHYPSFGELLSSYLATLNEHGQLSGFELLLPSLIAALGAVLVNRKRSNIAVKRDAPQAARPLP